MAKPRLGRGLEAILGDVEEAYAKELASGSQENLVLDIQTNKISPNPFQPRTNFDESALNELASSIERHGLIQPIIVIEKDGKYTLIAGERRLRATKILGLPTIKAVVADLKSQNLRELALIENIQRQDLNPIELANSYKELIYEYKITQDELSNIVKKSRSQITNTLRLLNLSDETKTALENAEISQGHAKIMVGLDTKTELEILQKIINNNLSVRQTEELIKAKKSNKIRPKSANVDEKYLSVFNKFKEILSKMEISSQLKGKKIILNCKNIENLKNLIEKISQK